MGMRLRQFAAFLMLAVLAAGCVSPLGTGETESLSADQVETIVSMTLQAMAPPAAETPAGVTELPGTLLPNRLYFLSPDSQGIAQLYRIEQDGRTQTQLTAEPFDVTDYDVSGTDGSVAYVVSGQLVLVNADGSNRRLVVDGGSGADLRGFYSPVFSPDGQTLAYAQNGLNLYSIATGSASLVIEDQVQVGEDGTVFPVELYSPVRYSPDGTKLLLALGHWEVAPSHGVYDPGTDSLVKYQEVEDYIYCCSFHGGPAWSPDSSSFYGVASVHDTAYQFGEIWRVDSATGALTRTFNSPLGDTTDGTAYLPVELYPAPDGHLYYFLGTYAMDSGYYDAPVLQLVRSGLDGTTDRTVLREENFVLMNEALWAPDASLVVVSTAVDRYWNQEGGVLELYPTDGQKAPVWLAPFGKQLKWGP